MGEIADALRRARKQLSPEPPREPAVRVPVRPPHPAPEPRALESLNPGDASAVAITGVDLDVCRQLALRVRSALERQGARSVVVTSAILDEGKTTVTSDLSLGLASTSRERDVAVVDLDLRKPSLAEALGISAEVGLESVLKGEASIDQVRRCVKHPPLDVYPAVERQRDAHELLVSGAFSQMIRALEGRYSIVVIDSPPALLFSDVSLLLEQVSSCIVVARAGYTRARLFEQLLDLVPAKQLLGQILNCARVPRHRYGYDDYTAEENAGSAAPGAQEAP